MLCGKLAKAFTIRAPVEGRVHDHRVASGEGMAGRRQQGLVDVRRPRPRVQALLRCGTGSAGRRDSRRALALHIRAHVQRDELMSLIQSLVAPK
jgi:hypothetical protein